MGWITAEKNNNQRQLLVLVFMLDKKLKFKFSYVWAWGHSFMTSAKKKQKLRQSSPCIYNYPISVWPHSTDSLDVLYGLDPPLLKPSMDMMFQGFLQKFKNEIKILM